MKVILATGEKSPICLEEGLTPVADMYLCFPNIYNSCLEEVNMIFQKGHTVSEETRTKIGLSRKGRKHSEDSKKRMSEAKRGGVLSENHKRKIANSLKGTRSKEHHPMWRGGKKLANARHYNNRRRRGLILLVANNPYNEPIVYHHIHPDLPYVVPCPVRIHEMFSGAEKTHFQNVNIMLGLRLEDCDFVNQPERIK